MITGSTGNGKIVVRTFGRESVFEELSYSYPLKLLSPKVTAKGKLPTSIAYALSYGGGLVAGDRVNLDVDVGKKAALIFLTQGSTKVFKTRTEYIQRLATSAHQTSTGDPKDNETKISTPLPSSSASTSSPTFQRMKFHVADNALLLLLVDPVTCFRDSLYIQHQTFYLTPSSSLILLDWITAGRISRGEEWDFLRYHSINEVWVGKKRRARDVLLLERTNLTESEESVPLRSRTLKERLAPYSCYATMMMFGPLVVDVARSLVEKQTKILQMQLLKPPDFMWSISELLGHGGTDPVWVLRVAGVDTDTVKRWLQEELKGVEELVGREAYSKTFR